MKLQLPKEDWKNRGPPPLIYYKADPTINKIPTDKVYSLKIYIKTQPEERDSKAVAIYVLMFRTGST